MCGDAPKTMLYILRDCEIAKDLWKSIGDSVIKPLSSNPIFSHGWKKISLMTLELYMGLNDPYFFPQLAIHSGIAEIC